jgi:hypothetical protein
MSEVIAFRVPEELHDRFTELVEVEEERSESAVARSLFVAGMEDLSTAAELARLRLDLARALGAEEELMGALEVPEDGLPEPSELARCETALSAGSIAGLSLSGPPLLSVAATGGSGEGALGSGRDNGGSGGSSSGDSTEDSAGGEAGSSGGQSDSDEESSGGVEDDGDSDMEDDGDEGFTVSIDDSDLA